jgi:DNA-binding response OmpR family regulator
MPRRATRLVLVASSDPACLRARGAMARDTGAYPLPAPLVARAIALVRKVRPSAVLVDVILSDGRGLDLVRALRAGETLGRVPVVLLGVAGPEERAHLSRDPHAHGLHGRDDTALGALLRGLLEDAPGAGA